MRRCNLLAYKLTGDGVAIIQFSLIGSTLTLTASVRRPKGGGGAGLASLNPPLVVS